MLTALLEAEQTHATGPSMRVLHLAATWALTSLVSLSQGCAGDDAETGATSGDAGATASPFGPNADADTGAASGDPGAPASPYGPKADAHLIVAEHEVGYVNFTAVASKQAALAHLYAIPGEVTNPLVSDYYISLVVDHADWHVGEYHAALGGRVQFSFRNGKSYAANGTDVALKLVVTAAGSTPGGTETYLRGTMDMTVPSAQSGQPPLRVAMNINSP